MAQLIVKAGLVVGLILLSPAPVRGYESERPERPGEGENVSARVRFFIAARGEADLSEHYKIEVGNEDFDTVIYVFDQMKDPKGWSLGVVGDLEGVSDEELEPWRGIYYTPRKALGDGEYLWRAFKHDGVGFEELRGEIPFRVDTIAPGPVLGLTASPQPDGSLRLTWRPVYEDAEGRPERVAGYRVYRYTTRHYFRRRDSILVGEVLDTRFTDLYAAEDEDELSYYQITAVDEAGNEAGRKFPLRLGETP